MSDVLKQLTERLYAGDAKIVPALAKRAFDEGLTPAEVLNGGLITGMDRVGIESRNCEVYLQEALIVARARHVGMNVLRPLLVQTHVAATG
jgi:5-methyltetrahydrofolate--homocysteine methyltransferase